MVNMIFLILLILSDISRVFTQSSPNLDRNEWDMLMLIEQNYKVGLDISDSDFMLNITRKNQSFKLPAQTLFPNRIIPEKLLIYFKLQPKVKSFTILAIRDPDQRVRFQIRGFEKRGQINEFRINVTMDPITDSSWNPRQQVVKTIEFTVPFLYSPWTLGILFDKRKVTFFTSCDDIEKPLGYHLVSNTVPIDSDMFKPGGTVYLFNDGSLGKSKDKFAGTVSEFIITNHTRLKEFMCRDEPIQGSGNKVNYWKMKFLGNVLLVNTTTTRSPKTTTLTTDISTVSSNITSTKTPTTTSIPTEIMTISSNVYSTLDGNKDSSNKKNEEIRNRSSSERNGLDCECLNFIRLNKPEKGSNGLKGQRGEKGTMGSPGISGQNGTCSLEQCRPTATTKGDKGESGSTGYCSRDVCKKASTQGPKGDQGIAGFPGRKGEKGDKQTTADVIASIIPEIKNTVDNFIIKNIKSLKGDKGTCNCKGEKSNDVKKSQIQTMVLNDVNELRPLSLEMSVGQMVFLIVENILLIKVDEVKNRWRIVKLDDTQTDWYLSRDTGDIMASQQVAPNPNTNHQNTEAKRAPDSPARLMLIALSSPTTGDLRSVSHEPGAYSGSSYQCQKNAYNFNLGRAFYPLINTDTFDFTYMVPEKYRYDVPIVNRKNETIAQSFDDLIKTSNYITAPIIDFNGKSIMTSIKPPCIWIGRRPSLYENKQPSEQGLCVNWMSRRMNTTGTSVHLILGKALLDPNNFQETPCHNYCYVLCMQIYPLTNDVKKP